MCCKDPKSSSRLLTLVNALIFSKYKQISIYFVTFFWKLKLMGCDCSKLHHQDTKKIKNQFMKRGEDAMKHEECEIKKDSHQQIEKFKNYSVSSFYANLLNNKSKKKSPNRNSSGRASNMFCNIITCGGVDTVDTVLESINRDNKAPSKWSMIKNDSGSSSSRGLNQERQKSSRRFESKKQQRNGLGESKVVSAAYKPVGGPTCSQCGKIFKPEKMHSHMKSCRGMKAFAKTTAETK